VALAGSLVAAAVLLVVFRRELRGAPSAAPSIERASGLRPAQRGVLAVVGAVLLACPVVAYFDGPVGAVAVVGAVAATLVAARDGRASPLRVLRDGIAWDVLVFLGLVNLLGAGLKNVGFVASLASVYAHGGLAGVGAVSALGSAVLNNHPMAILNMLALESVPELGARHVLAALVGGDLGPRLLPMGSLAGLLWFDLLRRNRVEVPMGRFFGVGLAVTLPTLAVSLLLLR
jgi:arsenical pump membrane protein